MNKALLGSAFHKGLRSLLGSGGSVLLAAIMTDHLNLRMPFTELWHQCGIAWAMCDLAGLRLAQRDYLKARTAATNPLRQ